MTQTELCEAAADGQGRPMRCGHEEASFASFFCYRLFESDGSDIGDAEYAMRVQPGDAIWSPDGRELRVTALVPVESETSSYTALLQVEAG